MREASRRRRQTKQGGPARRVNPRPLSERRLVEQLETGARVRSLSLHPCERGARCGRERRERRIVLDLAERALAAARHLHAGIENPTGVEAALHEREALAHFVRPDALEQRRTQPAVAVLASERAAEPRHETSDFVEDATDAITPIGDGNVDER